ncbi:MAG TPA: SCO family protein [Gallionellaceae bacterium]
MRTGIATLILLALGTWATWAITEGFAVVTAEQARRLDIARKQPAVPGVRLVDQVGRDFLLDAWVKQNNSLLVVEFIYTSCQSLCLALGTEFQQLQRSIVAQGLQDRVHLLSVSFDPAHDSPAVMRKYAERMQAQPATWTLATVRDARELPTLLRTFGVTVIPDQLGGFQHNAALVWVAPAGRLVRVTDLDANGLRYLLDELASS